MSVAHNIDSAGWLETIWSWKISLLKYFFKIKIDTFLKYSYPLPYIKRVDGNCECHLSRTHIDPLNVEKITVFMFWIHNIIFKKSSAYSWNLRKLFEIFFFYVFEHFSFATQVEVTFVRNCYFRTDAWSSDLIRSCILVRDCCQVSLLIY